jgi:acetolactate synthase-1/2/3 large subunit
MYAPIRGLSVPQPRGFVFAVNFGAIGLGVAMAAGVALGAPDRTTVAVVGDGGFMASGLGEFVTAVRYALDLVVVVVNDGSYGAEYHKLLEYGRDPKLSLFEWPELGALAEAVGGLSYTVRENSDLAGLRAVLATPRQRPLLIDVRIDPAARIGFHD